MYIILEIMFLHRKNSNMKVLFNRAKYSIVNFGLNTWVAILDAILN